MDKDASSNPVRPRRGLLVPVLLVVATIAAVLVVQQVWRGLPGWLNPFAEETKDRSGPVLLKSIRDLHRYEAASGNFQVIVDLEKDAKFLPSALRGKRTLFVGNGSVDAYVDFSKLGSGAVKVNADRTAATLTLPHAQLDKTNLDTKHSYVYATERGLFDRFGDFFSDNPSNQQQMYVLAAQKIQTAAAQSGLKERADANTKTMLENMLRALGFTTVTVNIGSR
ncbi:uncharacterized protein DUF4230 [Actinomadura pelletieri DSM 43383]|uniref:Uncharacterized protein DUF4230 n=1 Tax=Actinomadura pelletieri DSM 43383 TaxID=1120940 RepID=A0A495QTE4_9ACTN|nr:DUF4230 domain-containing protein [Actinomadura pelletieri]RKS76790.1 uncharacterized protein DUF4230 [Actinomadura pelletieri DSM 43383]